MKPTLLNRRPPAAAVVAVLLVCSVAPVAALTGVVLDAVTRQPVPYAAISAPHLGVSTVADTAGRFALALEPGVESVTVVASHVGYEEGSWSHLAAAEPATLLLQPRPIRLGAVSVSAFRTPTPLERSGPVTVIERTDAPAAGRLSVAELLWASPSVLARDYGNLTVVGLRGASAEQTLVLLDGVRLNSAQDNLFDLTTIPLNLAQRIEVVRGGSSALYGTNSIGGLLNVTTPEPHRLGAAGTVGVGAFGKRYVQVSHTNREEPLGYLVAGSLLRTGPDFSYRDATDSLCQRTNSDINSQDVMAKGTYGRGQHRIGLMGDYNVTRRGEPGPTSWPADSARMEDYRGLAHLSYDWQQAENSRFEARLYSHQLWRHFWNPDTLSWVNDTHVTKVVGATFKQTAHIAPWATAVAGIEGSRDEFRSTAIGSPRRLTGSGWLEARIRWLRLDIVPMARVDQLRESRMSLDSQPLRSSTRAFSPKLSLAYSGPSWLNLYASCGRSFRAPTFNERYWPEDPWTRGNPQLRPEWATSVDLHATARYRSYLTGRLGIWHTSLVDLIQWQPDSAYVYRPVNLDSATITGTELELSVRSKHLSVAGHATYMLARSRGNDLPYRPRLDLAVSHQLSWELVQVTWDVRRTGKRYADADNTDSLPGFLLFDVGLGLAPGFGWLKTALRGGVRNLFDRQYEVIKDYPVPGRSWYAEIELRV